MIAIETQNAEEFLIIEKVFKKIKGYKCSDYFDKPSKDEQALFDVVDLERVFKGDRLDKIVGFELSTVDIFGTKFVFTDINNKMSFTIKKKTLTKEEKDLEKLDDDYIVIKNGENNEKTNCSTDSNNPCLLHHER